MQERARVARRTIRIIGLAVGILLVAGNGAWAWGPLTHIRLSQELLANLWMLSPAVAALLAKHARYFVFGNIAADVVFAKKLSRVKQICHRWSTGFTLLDAARTEESRAFASGYLAHLAADTVAHNKYLPRQIMLCGSTIALGHLYWEVRADAAIEQDHWTPLRSAIRHRYVEAERLMQEHLTATLLPFGINRRIFRRMNLLTCANSWRRTVRVMSKVSRWPLPWSTLNDYHAESLDRIISVLQNGSDSPVVREDPNGNTALLMARARRRQVRRLKRERLPVDDLVHRVARAHEPRPGPWLETVGAGASRSSNIVN